MEPTTTTEPRKTVRESSSKRREHGEVMLLLEHGSLTYGTIDRAVRLSNAANADLHVTLVLPPSATRQHPALLVREVEMLLGVLRGDRGFTLEMPRQTGDLVAHGVAAARVRRPSLIVVDERCEPAIACRLVDALRTPVLVARTARPAGSVIACTTTGIEKPIVSLACGLARPLRRSVTVLDEPSSVATIADQRDADIVVVGHRRRSWLARVFGDDEIADFVEQCSRSVAIAPVDA